MQREGKGVKSEREEREAKSGKTTAWERAVDMLDTVSLL